MIRLIAFCALPVLFVYQWDAMMALGEWLLASVIVPGVVAYIIASLMTHPSRV